MFKINAAKIAVLSLLASPGVYMPYANAFDFGSLTGAINSLRPSGGASNPDGFLSSALAAERLMKNSRDLMVYSLASKEEIAKLDAMDKVANEKTDPAEKDAAVADLDTSKDAALNEALNDSSTKDKIAQMDSQQKSDLGAAAFNFMLALLKDQSLMQQSTGLVSSMSSNPASMGKIGEVKDASVSIAHQVSTASQIAGKMPAIFSAVEVNAPVSMNDKPMSTARVAGD